MQDIWVSLHSIQFKDLRTHSFHQQQLGTSSLQATTLIVDRLDHDFNGDTINNLFTRHAFEDLAGYPRILDIDD
jgi:hypothetical protein